MTEKSAMIKNPKTGRMVKKNGAVGKKVQKDAATAIQKIYRGKLNRNKLKRNKMDFLEYLRGAQNAGFHYRYVKEFVDAFNYFPTFTELDRFKNSGWARELKNHFRINNLRPGNPEDVLKKRIDNDVSNMLSRLDLSSLSPADQKKTANIIRNSIKNYYGAD